MGYYLGTGTIYLQRNLDYAQLGHAARPRKQRKRRKMKAARMVKLHVVRDCWESLPSYVMDCRPWA